MGDEQMSVSDYMHELSDSEKQVSAADLTQLSGLMGQEEEEFKDGWEQVPADRRTEVIGRLVELADDNAELDFHAVFCHALQDEEPAVREQAVSGLWETDDRRTIPKLIDRLEHDTVDEVRAAAAQAMSHFADLADEGKLVPRDVDRIWNALKAALEDDDEPLVVRRRALESIATFRTKEVTPWIKWGFDHPEPLLRQSAVFAMGRSGDPKWLGAIVEEMESDDPAMRFEACNAAREIAEEDALPYLADLVHDPDAQVSLAALHAIAGIGGQKARRMLKQYAASTSDPATKEAAQEALGIVEADMADFSMMQLPVEPDDEDFDDES